ncbi:MAG: endonuclease/exonuclease/phosphatase family protein [bacterium]
MITSCHYLKHHNGLLKHLLKGKTVKRILLFVQLFLIPCLTTATAQIDTLRICTYNVLKFSENTGQNRFKNFRFVLNAVQPDVLVVQEMISATGMNVLRDSVLNHQTQNEFASGPFIDGPDTDNAIFFRQQKVQLLASRQISTDLRDISEYTMLANDVEFRLYSVHLKAGQASNNAQRRFSETTVLRNHLNNLPDSTHFIVLGDFNIYSASEDAFAKLTDSETDNDGRAFDPVMLAGAWHNNRTFAAIHTQSVRTTSFGGGATGGLDDRFDMILVSGSIYNALPGRRGAHMKCLAGSYTSFGNDGQHFNQSINAGGNGAVAANIANALHEVSDHLPVYVDFELDPNKTISSISRFDGNPNHFTLLQNYPNPFNPSTKISYSISAPAVVRLSVYDISGKEVAILVDEFKSPGSHQVEFKATDLMSGVYFYRLHVNGLAGISRKMILLK